jgi:sulfatase maturation enzyme AslB (radical SAM superfamily)
MHEKEVTLMKKENIELSSWLKFVDDEWAARGADKEQPFPNNIIEHIPNLREISIEGGEPFANKKILDLLDLCIDNNLLDLKIVTTTNLTSLTDRVIEKLSKMNNVHLWVSWDSLDAERFKFIRFPAVYDHFIKNLHKLENTNVRINFSYTLSVFNIFDVVDTLREFENHDVDEIVFKPVVAPNYFSPRYLTTEQKQQVINSLNQYTTSRKELQQAIDETIHLLSFDEGDFTSIVAERTRMLNVYDQLRGTDYKKLFPYL